MVGIKWKWLRGWLGGYVTSPRRHGLETNPCSYVPASPKHEVTIFPSSCCSLVLMSSSSDKTCHPLTSEYCTRVAVQGGMSAHGVSAVQVANSAIGISTVQGTKRASEVSAV